MNVSKTGFNLDLFKKSVVLCGKYTCTAQNSEINFISSFICYFLFFIQVLTLVIFTEIVVSGQNMPIQVLTLVIFTEILVSGQNMHAQAFMCVSRVEWGEGGECQEFCEIKISLNFSVFRGWNLLQLAIQITLSRPHSTQSVRNAFNFQIMFEEVSTNMQQS